MNEQYSRLDKDNQLIWNLRDLGHTLRRISEGKGSQKRILIILLETGGLTQKELTARLGVQAGSASEVISKLEAGGLIERTPSPSDHRTADIRLTEKGRSLAQEAYLQRRERHRQMFSSLSAEEKDTLIHLLEKVNQDWEQKYRAQEGD